MIKRFKNIIKASQQALEKKWDWFWFLVISLGFFFLFVFVPVITTPGNDILFQLSIMGLEVYVLMIALSFLNALVVMFHKHIRRVQKTNVTVVQVGSGLSALASGLLATISCGACYSGVLTLLGLGGTVFVIEHRWWFAVFAGGLAIWAIDSAASKIVAGCKSCSIAGINGQCNR